LNILWLSNAPWAPTGYGNQTRLFVPRLKKLGHDMAISAFYGLQGGVLHWDGIRVYPGSFHPYGQDICSAQAKHYNADLMISLIDIWVLLPENNLHKIPWAPWFPVDHDPCPPAIVAKAKQADFPLMFSKFGQKAMADAGVECAYIPHGVDTNLFKPIDRTEARKALAVSDDRFIVGMIAANKGNPSRKAFAENIAAFAQFNKRHSDALLYLHVHRGEHGEMGGVNLPELCGSLGLKEGANVLFCDPFSLALGFPDPYMVNAYNAMDVLLNVSMGEGFGIPILEAQACGTPVIVGDWTSMPEICFSGWKIDKSDAEPWWAPMASYQFMPHIAAISEALEKSYRNARDKGRADQARQGALAYDADLITETYWKPVLEDIAGRIGSHEPKAEAF